MGLIFTYSLMIQHGANKYDIMTIAKHAHKLLYGVTNLVISFNKVFRDSLPETNIGSDNGLLPNGSNGLEPLPEPLVTPDYCDWS